MINWRRTRRYHYRDGGKKKWNHVYSLWDDNILDMSITCSTKEKAKQMLDWLTDTMTLSSVDNQHVVKRIIYKSTRD